MAYKYYLRAAERGHIRGALHLADIWTTGLPGYVNRRPSDAVLLDTSYFIYFTSHIWYFLISWLTCLFNFWQVGKMGSWAQWIPGQHLKESLGFISQEWHVIFSSIHTYHDPEQATWLQLQQIYYSRLFNRFSSLLYYTIAAELGYAAAQFNVAYLCEQNTVCCRNVHVKFFFVSCCVMVMLLFYSLQSFLDTIFTLYANREVFWILLLHCIVCGDITTSQHKVKILTLTVNPLLLKLKYLQTCKNILYFILILFSLQPWSGWVTCCMRGRSTGRRTYFRQQRCTNWQH